MKFVIITADPALAEEARKGLGHSGEVHVHANGIKALDDCEGADLMFLDMIAVLDPPNKSAGYEAWAQAKMAHPVAKSVPLVLINPPLDYDIDFLVGYPGFAFLSLRRPVEAKLFERAKTFL